MIEYNSHIDVLSSSFCYQPVECILVLLKHHHIYEYIQLIAPAIHDLQRYGTHIFLSMGFGNAEAGPANSIWKHGEETDIKVQPQEERQENVSLRNFTF